MTEASTLSALRLAAAREGNALWRNNSGACVDKTGRMIRYGLGNDSTKINKVFKSSDLIGITSIMVTPDMVGLRLGVFTAVECKADGPVRQSDRLDAQVSFLMTVRGLGGLAIVAQSAEDYMRMLGK